MLKIRSKVVSATAAFALGLVFAGCSEILSRDDFAARVKDKSDTEVAKIVGKPAAVDSTKPNEVTWTYNSRTFNVAERNKFDSKAVVVFNKTSSDGSLRAVDVKFE
jgi:hypothetical protein